MRRAAIPVLAAAALLAAAWPALGGAGIAQVPPGASVEDAVARARGGAVHLLPGVHGPFRVTEPGAVVVAAPGAVVRGPVEVRADGVALHGLRIVGGENGVTVRDAEGVRLERLWVTGARVHGVEVIDAQAVVRDCVVAGLASRYGQGVEVRNASTRPRSVVEGCRISGGQEGIITHSSRVEIRENSVTGTTLRGIAISEMSEGTMEGNVVTGVVGVALYCGDMSHCEIVGNRVRDVRPDPSGVRSRAGHAVVGWYYSTLRLRDNDVEGAASPLHLTLGSVETERFPLGVWPPGWRGALPALWVSAIALLGALAVVTAARPATGWVLARTSRWSLPPSHSAGLFLLTGLGIQSFHMLEHGVQVFQVYVAHSERRSGILGSFVDTEWVHFTYNLTVLGFLLLAWALVGREGGRPSVPARAMGRTAPLLLAAIVIQGYHLAEHVAKVVQHVSTGIDPAPGIVGGDLGLVWFHFGINLAVYAAMAWPLLRLAGRMMAAPEGRPARRLAVDPA